MISTMTMHRYSAGASACPHQPRLACAPRLRQPAASAAMASVAAPAADFATHGVGLRSDAAASAQQAILSHLQHWAAVNTDDEQLTQPHVAVMDTLCMLSYDEEQDEDPAAVLATMQRNEDFINAMDTLCLLSYDDDE